MNSWSEIRGSLSNDVFERRSSAGSELFVPFGLDLLQVDLLASGASLFGREAADRERRSRESIWNPTKDFFESLPSAVMWKNFSQIVSLRV